MNLAWQIAHRASHHLFHLLTLKNGRFEEKNDDSVLWEHVYSNKGLSILQKMELFFWLIFHSHPRAVYHILNSPASLSSFILRLIVNRRGIVSIQTISSIAKRQLSSARFRMLYFADYLIAISDYAEQKLKMLGHVNVRRINVGIDTSVFAPVVTNHSAAYRWGIKLGAPIVLFAGEYARQGSVDLILKAIPRVVEMCPQAGFVFACRLKTRTDERKEKRVKDFVRKSGMEEHVLFLNTVDDMKELLNACTVFIFPVEDMVGKFDTPMVLLEAMAMEKPVIITDIPPLNEVFKNDIGFLVPQNDVNALTNAIIESLNADPRKSKQWGQNARKIVCDYYSIDRVALEYEKLYDEIESRTR